MHLFKVITHIEGIVFRTVNGNCKKFLVPLHACLFSNICTLFYSILSDKKQSLINSNLYPFASTDRPASSILGNYRRSTEKQIDSSRRFLTQT